MKKIDLLEAVSMIDMEDLKKEIKQYGFSAVEHEVIRALISLESLRLDLVDAYYQMLNDKRAKEEEQ